MIDVFGWFIITAVQGIAIAWTIVGILTLRYLWPLYQETKLTIEGLEAQQASEPEKIKANVDRRSMRGRVWRQIGSIVLGVVVLAQPWLFPGLGIGGLVLGILLIWNQYAEWRTTTKDRTELAKLDRYLREIAVSSNGYARRRTDALLRGTVAGEDTPQVQTYTQGEEQPS